jgi:hypothetical protein
MQHRLARNASLHVQWLHAWRHHCLAHGASLRISCCMQCSITWHVMPRVKVNGYAHGSSIAWLVMPRFESMAAHMAARSTAAHMVAAPLGTWCIASYQLLLHARRHRLARDVSVHINGGTHGSRITWHVVPRTPARVSFCMQYSVAWHAVPRFESTAERMAAAPLGT